ncbi:MAG: glycosyltransferase [Muribaculaceae bacterium]|nr:glycosyltransferase [Muribaculaceae bacterium]
MNILFITYFQVVPVRGGIGRVTDVLARELRIGYGHKCHSLYIAETDPAVRNPNMDSECHCPSLTEGEVCEAVRRVEADVIISQELNTHSEAIRGGVDASGRRCKVVYAHHSTPMAHEKAFLGFGCMLGEYRRKPSVKGFARLAGYPLYRFIKLRGFRRCFRRTGETSDAVVLLSDRFVPLWLETSGTGSDDAGRISAIPNPVSFDTYAVREEICRKERRLLVVSRMSEIHKRTMMVLEAWREIQDDAVAEGWQLDIVGDGDDLDAYKDYASKHLERVNFYGQQPPRKYYDRASVFLMTSRFEGWGLTLTEAGQSGCAVVAVDSYLSLRDIIIDGENGLLVPEGDFKAFIAAIKRLMADKTLRENMGLRGVELAGRFSGQNVAAKWNRLFNKLMDS